MSKTRDPVANEVTRQLIELKKQLNKERLEDMHALKDALVTELTESITASVMTRVDEKLENFARAIRESRKRDSESIRKAAAKDAVAEMDKRAPADMQLAVQDQNRELALQVQQVQHETRELVLQVGQQIQNSVYRKVLGEINTKILPEINKTVRWVNYNLQDGAEVVNEYRRGVERQANPHLQDGQLLLTDGKVDKQVIGNHVRMAWGDEFDD